MEQKQDVKHIIRICNSDIVGTKKIYHALRKIRGISYTFSNAICNALNMDRNVLIGAISQEDVKRIEDVIHNPLKFNIPVWIVNRRKDFDTGKNIHLVGSDLKLRTDFDIKIMKKIKSYKGIRHAIGQPVRGQRTRAHFRKGSAIGVRRKEAKMAKTKGREEKK